MDAGRPPDDRDKAMTRRAVVAYPALSPDDHRWIEGIRARCDPWARRIAAHFTLVFPTEVAEAPLEAELRHALQSARPILVVLRRAAALPDAAGTGCHVLLPAEEGRSELAAIHEKLYEGALAAHRRRDIPFMPHITLGAHPELVEGERIARELNGEGRMVKGRIDRVDLIEVGESTVQR